MQARIRLANQVAITFALVALASEPLRGADEICPYGKLEWADFKGTVPASTTLDAETCGGVNANWTSTVPKAETSGFSSTLGGITSKPFFNKSQSWVKPGSMTAALLEHEQYHMDLYEVWARKTEQILKGIKGTGATAAAANADANAKAAAALAQAQTDCDAVQSQYDTDTNHGTNAAEQAKWCKKIGDMLNPPKPKRDAGTTGTSGAGYDPGNQGMTVPGSPMDAFESNGVPFNDPYLFGGQLQIPQLFFEGNRMGLTPWLFPDLADTAVVLFEQGGQPVLQGNLLMLIGDESSQTFLGWIEDLTLDPIAVAQSPLLQQIEAATSNGESIVTVQLVLGTPMDLATSGWTQPAFVPGQLTIGTTLPTAVPGMSAWGLALMTLLLAGAGAYRLANPNKQIRTSGLTYARSACEWV
jgi:hypothetical protein